MVSLGGVDGKMNKMSFSPVMRSISPTRGIRDDDEDGIRQTTTTTEEEEYSDNNQLISTSNPNINIIQATPPSNILNSSGVAFKPLNTITPALSLLATTTGVFVVSVIIPTECNSANHDCYIGIRPLSLLLYMHCMFWAFALICDQCIQYQHIRLRRRGYLEFYSDTRTLSQLPFWIVSTWSTLLLTITTILHDHCHNESNCGKTIRLKKSEYVTICIGIEFILIFFSIVPYLLRVWRFNQDKSPPDVLREDVMTSSTFGQEFGSQLQSAGVIDEEIYERQADMIRYYKEHNSMLRKTVLELSRQLNDQRQAATPNF